MEHKGHISISKEQLAGLEAASFDGKVYIIETEEEVEKALDFLEKQGVLGIDTETRPSFRKGQLYKVSLLQISTLNEAFLFRINKTGITPRLKELLENPEIKKIGLSLHDDFNSLKRLTEINPQNCIDLQGFVKDFRIADNSLSKIYAVIFGKRICKGQRLTNWEIENLTVPQIQYAALDAYACIEIYNHLISNKFHPELSPYYSESSEPDNI